MRIWGAVNLAVPRLDSLRLLALIASTSLDREAFGAAVAQMPKGSTKPHPFRLLISFAATFPVNGDSFWVVVADTKRLHRTAPLSTVR